MNWVTLVAIPARPFMLLGMLVVANLIAGQIFRRVPPGRVRDFLFRPRMIIKHPDDYAQ